MDNANQDIIQDLNKTFGESFDEISTRPDAEQLPKSTVVLKITNAYLGRSSRSNRMQLSAVCTVLECSAGDEFKGHTYTKNWGLQIAENLSWLKTDLLHLEIDVPSKPADLVNTAHSLIGVCFTGALVPKDEAFPPNCYINRGARRRDLEGVETTTTTQETDTF